MISAAHPGELVRTMDRRQLLTVYSGLMLAMLLAALDATIVATALPTIVTELGGLAHLSWVVTAYLVAQTIVTPLYGKLGDLYGRKVVMQAAIVVFLAGSALCGASRSMAQLIGFRAVQGLGGGGLVVTAQAVVGDIVAPRDRGRYQGVFGAVFGLASIAGPLLGGYFTTQWTWRWIFYINLPLGLIALVVIASVLPGRLRRLDHAIDYAGALALTVGLAATILACDLGGATYARASAPLAVTAAIAIAGIATFLAVERRAAEPLLPPRLFRERTFTVAVVLGFIVGFALFGSVTYLPLFLQQVQGVSPTTSGLYMLPMLVGLPLTSVICGQIVSRTGRYRALPIIGTAVATMALGGLSWIAVDTSTTVLAVLLFALGAGLGMVMQVLIIAIQNAVDYRDLGAATSSAMLFRLVGGSVGTAILGAVMASQLAAHASLGGAEAFTLALDRIFLVAAAISAIGAVLAWRLPERPLRQSIAAVSSSVGASAGEAFAMPTTDEAASQLVSSIAALTDRETQRAHMNAILQRAGLTLTPLDAWVLWRLDAESAAALGDAARRFRIDAGRLDAALRSLETQGLITPALEITPAGRDLLDRFLRARRERITQAFADWPEADRAALGTILGDLAQVLTGDDGSRRVTTGHDG